MLFDAGKALSRSSLVPKGLIAVISDIDPRIGEALALRALYFVLGRLKPRWSAGMMSG
jgi:hypothetical protein